MKIPKKLSQNISFMLNQTAKTSQVYLDKEMEALGLTRSQWLLLSQLYFVNGRNQQELASLMDIGKGALGKLAHKLENKGWIRREADKSDKRAIRLFITDNTYPMVEKLVELLFEVTDRSLTGITKEEIALMRSLMNRIRTNIEVIPPSEKWTRIKSELVAELTPLK